MSGKKIIQGLHEAIAHTKGTDSLKERLRVFAVQVAVINPPWATMANEALARIEELEEECEAEFKSRSYLQSALAKRNGELGQAQATIAKLEGDIDKEVYARVERWRSSVEAIQAKLDRAREGLAIITTAHQWRPNSDGAIMEQCIQSARATLEELK